MAMMMTIIVIEYLTVGRNCTQGFVDVLVLRFGGFFGGGGRGVCVRERWRDEEKGKTGVRLRDLSCLSLHVGQQHRSSFVREPFLHVSLDLHCRPISSLVFYPRAGCSFKTLSKGTRAKFGERKRIGRVHSPYSRASRWLPSTSRRPTSSGL